jgi:hypothetical protein
VETPFDSANWRLSVLTDSFEGLAIVVERQQSVPIQGFQPFQALPHLGDLLTADELLKR